MEYTQQSGYQQNKPSNNKKYAPIIVVIVAILLLIIFWSRITVTIPAGHGGVLYRLFGGVKDLRGRFPFHRTLEQHDAL